MREWLLDNLYLSIVLDRATTEETNYSSQY